MEIQRVRTYRHHQSQCWAIGIKTNQTHHRNEQGPPDGNDQAAKYLRTNQVLCIGIGRKQLVIISSIGNFYFDHPSFSVRIGVYCFWRTFKRVIEFNDFTRQRQE